MVTISAKTRKIFGRKVRKLRENGILPGIVYGPGLKNISLELNLKEFKDSYKLAGESSLISLNLSDKNKKILVLVRDVETDPLTGESIHVDFYQPRLEEKVVVTVPLVFKGESPAVKNLGGTLVKSITELEIKALPQDLPHKIDVDIEKLKTSDDDILIKDLIVPSGVEILRGAEDVVASISLSEDVEEELEKPIEEDVEKVEKVKREKKEKEEEKSK